MGVETEQGHQTSSGASNGFDLAATASDGVERLRDLILSLAVNGKLLPQNSEDEPASKLLDVLKRVRDSLARSGQMKRFEVSNNNEGGSSSLPRGWKTVRLGSVLKMVNGRAFKPTDWKPDGIPIVRIQNLNRREAPFNYCDEKDVDDRHLIRDGDLLISWSGTPGTSFGAFLWDRGTAALNQHIFRCAQVAPIFIPEFLRLAINSRLGVLIAHAQGGVGLQHVTKRVLEGVVLNLPPMAEQERIVQRHADLMRICDSLEEHRRLESVQHARLASAMFEPLIARESSPAVVDDWWRVANTFDLLLDRPEEVDKLEKTILQLAMRGFLETGGPIGQVQEKFPALSLSTVQLFSVPSNWAWVTLGSLIADGPTNGYSPKQSNTGSGVRCLTLSATTKGYFRPDCFKFVDVPDAVAAQYYLKRGDLLVQRANSIEHVGMPAIYDGADDEYTYPDLMMRMRLRASFVFAPFIHLWLITEDARAYVRSKATGTQGNMPKINQGVVKQIPVPLPPLAQQERIVARVKELRVLCAQLRSRLESMTRTQEQLAEALALLA
jgi:type I restriction enzyme, S subunit